MSLKDKNILLGVCGSIAAYKIASLIRLLVKAEAHVQVVMTPDATQFITPLTLSTLSNNPVLVDYFNPKTGEWNNHVHLGLQSDLILIAPASANTIGKLANGLCDNLLAAVYLSAKCPVYLAPAMDLDMWQHAATRRNIALLASYGNIIIPPGNGELASGLVGEGRLAEPEDILSFLLEHSTTTLPLKGKRALVTAGPTYEAIDPVRFIGNHSSGKMGYAIAARLQRLGADVTLVSGPTSLKTPQNVTQIAVQSAAQMFEACEAEFQQADIIVMSAAVADYTPTVVADQKIKKKAEDFSIALKKTTDILATLGKEKREGQTLVGFALETNNELENAIDKLHRKNLDLIVLNSMQDKGAGFATDTNKITLIDRARNIHSYDLKSKEEVAKDICMHIIAHQTAL
ncbi:bifunctional phosphopantothenoylcysteine decarboxylase/phosphopantothenate--cysteine ligase CoaBC [Sphingobacterium alkalisoli]|uniref:Coenzyme A biosynthesis bifunctional protein CoaBC n=1 Tax=Sphingobacterium alkalisoli TaxID=1874115 RepID=A0A4U0GQP7_9SPHI|nr:bifunctional phosphopantothenoylcysteine decarboxylase/phosphopantothenate--cysteine ligase CoaBC [Sphingobacterium alkalisoli]TJY61271.1 bifunctional phosphopantothenoylcysteine decarboxylase/phosphopantothenate--cysteine ligase CoaBC [Sphingobacterium alkalisoli]GGH31285.1 phosphopantothenoylcysteine decarboxylase [Sphingobacterium alkalisoli]